MQDPLEKGALNQAVDYQGSEDNHLVRYSGTKTELESDRTQLEESSMGRGNAISDSRLGL